MKFTIEKSRFGLFTSIFEDGTRGTTALTEDACRFVTVNIRIPVLQNTWEGTDSNYEGTVQGKL